MKQTDNTKAPEAKFVRNVRHTFGPDELQQLGLDLARAFGEHRGVEAEFDKVKADYKAQLAVVEAKIESLSTARTNGFEFRIKNCFVVFRPKDKKKDFYVEGTTMADIADTGPNRAVPALTEPMTSEDYQQELLEAEAAFENREAIDLFTPVGEDFGKLIIGRQGDKWYSALRIKVGRAELIERLDSEQRSYRLRSDAVARAIKRVAQWAGDNLKDAAKGFKESFQKVEEANREKVE